MLLPLGWAVASGSLFTATVAFDLYWNLFDWRPNFGLEAMLWASGIVVTLAFIWWLAKITHDKAGWIASALVCLVLLGCAVAFGLSEEHANGGLLGRTTLSPWWYRMGRSLLLCLPAVFWLQRFLRRCPTAT